MAGFDILLAGMFPEDNVRLERENACIDQPAWVSALYDEEWERLTAEKEERGERPPFDGAISHFIDFRYKSDQLTLQCGRMRYKQLIGARVIAEPLQRYFPEYLPIKLGVSSVIITPDDQFLTSKRSKDVVDCPGWYSVGAGGGLPVDAYSVFDGMRKELRSEYGIQEGDIEHLVMTGLARLSPMGPNEVEMLFATRVNQTKEQLREREEAEEEWENQQKMSLPNDPDEVAHFIVTNDRKITPNSTAVTVLYGKTNPFQTDGFGEEWYQRTMEALQRQWVIRISEHSRLERTVAGLIEEKYGLR